MENESEDHVFSHYTPQHPLPEEIKKLARDDTICKYCGISYLIHNEIKALEDKLASLEKELTHFRGQEKREALLQKENDLLKDQRNDLQSSLDTEKDLVVSLKAELEGEKKRNKNSEEISASYKEKYMTALRHFSALSQIVRQQKQTLELVRKQVDTDRAHIQRQIEEVEETVTVLGQTANTECETLQSRVQCLDMEKLVLSQSISALTTNLKEAEQRLAQKESELQSQKNSIANLEKNMLDSEVLSENARKLEVSIQELQKELASSQTASRTSAMELDQCKSQLGSKNTELKDKIDKINQLEKDYEISLQKLNLELRNREGELAASTKQQKTLENQLRELERREADNKHSRDMSQNETQALKESLQRAKSDSEALKAEREMMIEAHQNRIEELRESFKNKMAEMDNWPQKLQAAVAAEKAKHQTELKTLEDSLKHNFVLELQIEKDKYNELLKKFQSQERDKTSMKENEKEQLEQKYRQEVEELRRLVAEGRRREQEREEELQGEISSLKKIINDLQDRLARLDNDGSEHMVKLKSDLAAALQEVADAQSTTAALQAKLKEAEQEGHFLQKIVQKECEERFELTEALSEARKQLLELKRPPGGYNSGKRGSITSLGSAQSISSHHSSAGGGHPGPGSQHLPSQGGPTLPTPPPLASLSVSSSSSHQQQQQQHGQHQHQQASSITLSYTNKNNSGGMNNISSGRSSGGGGGGGGGGKDPEAQLRESRKRIAHMMGRIS